MLRKKYEIILQIKEGMWQGLSENCQTNGQLLGIHVGAVITLKMALAWSGT